MQGWPTWSVVVSNASIPEVESEFGGSLTCAAFDGGGLGNAMEEGAGAQPASPDTDGDRLLEGD